MIEFETYIEIESPCGLLQDVPAMFEMTGETRQRERYSWGQSRGEVTDYRAKLKWIKLGEHEMSRGDVIDMLGEMEAAELEVAAAEKYEE